MTPSVGVGLSRYLRSLPAPRFASALVALRCELTIESVRQVQTVSTVCSARIKSHGNWKSILVWSPRVESVL